MFFWEGKQHFFRRFLAGAFIAIVMTGLDQDMMQKNLSCKTIGEAQKHMIWCSWVLLLVNILFLVSLSFLKSKSKKVICINLLLALGHLNSG